MAGIGTEQFDAEATAALADAYLGEDEVLRAARDRAAEYGLSVPSPGVGAALRFLAALTDARSVVEVGTGTGVTGIWLLRGMRPDGVLTSVDPDPDYQRAARTAYSEAGVAANRARLIAGRPREVLPRLTDGGYDLMWVCADPLEYVDYLRDLGQALLESEEFAAVLLPLGTGLLAATKRPLR